MHGFANKGKREMQGPWNKESAQSIEYCEGGMGQRGKIQAPKE